jgi:hypothetical protein
MPITLNGDTGITTPMYNGSITANAVTPSVNMKNRIINGAMVIDQRNAGASVTPTTANTTFSVDRWLCNASQATKYTVQQNAGSVTPPAGFVNYMGVTSSSAYSITSSDYFFLEQDIEGLNCGDLAWGTANAKTVTLSFWVYSSLTGTFGASLRNSSGGRSYPFSYTISAANTWEYKTVTIAGDTSGTWLTTNGIGIRLSYSIGSGSNWAGTAGAWNSDNDWTVSGAVSVVGTNGATFYITGVQLEVGSTATSFDYRPYTTELQLCQRYCINYRSADAGVYMRYGSGYANSATNFEINVHFPVTMRTNPSLTVTSTASNYGIYVAGGVNACSTVPALDSSSDNPSVSTLNASSASTFSSSGGGSIISNNNTTSYMLFTAEL